MVKSCKYGIMVNDEKLEITLMGKSKKSIEKSITTIQSRVRWANKLNRLSKTYYGTREAGTLYSDKLHFEKQITHLKSCDKMNMDKFKYYLQKLSRIDEAIHNLPLTADIKVIEDEEKLIAEQLELQKLTIADAELKIKEAKNKIITINKRQQKLDDQRLIIASEAFEASKVQAVEDYKATFIAWCDEKSQDANDPKIFEMYKLFTPYKEPQPPTSKKRRAKKAVTSNAPKKSGEPKKCIAVSDDERCGARILIRDENNKWGSFCRCKNKEDGSGLCSRHTKKNEEGIYGDGVVPEKYQKYLVKPSKWWTYLTTEAPTADENRAELCL